MNFELLKQAGRAATADEARQVLAAAGWPVHMIESFIVRGYEPGRKQREANASSTSTVAA